MFALAFQAAAEEDQPNPFLPANYDLLWSFVVFVFIVGSFMYWILPKLQKVLDERSQLIEGGIAKAEAIQREASVALEEYTQQLMVARQDAARVREEARVQATQILEAAHAQAVVDSRRVVDAATKQIQAERQQVITALRGELGILAIELASRIVGETLEDDARQQRVVDAFLADIESAEAKG